MNLQTLSGILPPKRSSPYAARLAGWCSTRRNRTGTPLRWKWNKGAGTSLADFGDPLTATTYGVCVHDETDGNPILLMDVAAQAGTGWAKTATGFKYTNKAPTGNQPQQITLHAAEAGKANISVSGRPPAWAGRIAISP